MTPETENTVPDRLAVHVPVARSKALTRGAFWIAPAIVLGFATLMVYERVDLRPTAVSSRFVEYSLLLAGLPFAMSAALCVFVCLRWLLLWIWPGNLVILASEDELTFRLGPFGTRRYDAGRFVVSYPFELSPDEEGSGFEAYLPEEEQIETLLPRVDHPDAPGPLNLLILRYVTATEREMAGTLRTVIRGWRARQVERPSSTSAE